MPKKSCDNDYDDPRPMPQKPPQQKGGSKAPARKK